MEDADLFSRSVGQLEEAARLGIREAVPTIQRALVPKTRARMVGAAEDAEKSWRRTKRAGKSNSCTVL